MYSQNRRTDSPPEFEARQDLPHAGEAIHWQHQVTGVVKSGVVTRSYDRFPTLIGVRRDRDGIEVVVHVDTIVSPTDLPLDPDGIPDFSGPSLAWPRFALELADESEPAWEPDGSEGYHS